MVQQEPPSLAFTGTLHVFSALSSTNDEAMRMAGAGFPHGTAVLAHRQAAGRGRQGRRWHSPDGGLYLSVLLRPALEPARQAYLPLVAGIALRSALSLVCGISPDLKWPNDILAQGAKLAGILIENVPGTSAGSGFAVVGLGVNLAGAPEELTRFLARPATSLAAVTGRDWRPDELLPQVLEQLERWYRELALTGPAVALAEWRRHDGCLGQELEWHQPDGSLVRGLAQGLDDSGAYSIQAGGGGLMLVLAGDLLPVGVTGARRQAVPRD